MAAFKLALVVLAEGFKLPPGLRPLRPSGRSTQLALSANLTTSGGRRNVYLTTGIRTSPEVQLGCGWGPRPRMIGSVFSGLVGRPGNLRVPGGRDGVTIREARGWSGR